MGRLRRLALFCALWLPVGFSLGTSTLLGPVRWLTGRGRAAGWEPTTERAVVIAVIAVYVLVSAAVALALAVAVRKTSRRHVRLGVPAIAWVAALAAVWLFLHPVAAGIDRGDEERVGAAFTFGPYPTAERMAALAGEGYTAVISLLHPAVVPFEPKLLADERAAAAAAGIDLIELPMLPWVDRNDAALAEIARLAREGRGRYYVHCYLGRDRVLMARTVVESHAAEVVTDAATLARQRHLEDGLALERGRVVELADGVFLGPYPTDDEWTAYFATGAVRSVVSLLDPDHDADVGWIERERTALAPFGIELVEVPFAHERPYADDALDRAVAAARSAARPVYVHAFLGVDTGRSPAAEAFAQAWRTRAASVLATVPGATLPDDSGTADPAGDGERGFVARLVPSARTIVLLGPPLVLYAAAAAWFAGWLRTGVGMRTPYTRKIFHLAVFSTAGVLHLVAGLSAVALFGGIVSVAVVYAVVRGDGFSFYEALARPTDAPRRSLFVLVPLATTAVGGLLSNALFGAFATVGYLVGGWGDAVGEPVGTAIGRHRYAVPSLGGVPATRSLEGSAAVTLAGTAAAFVALTLAGHPAPAAAGAALACGFAGAAVEAVSHHGLDNLTIQVAASGVAFWLLA